MRNSNNTSEIFTSPESFAFEQWPVYKASLELCAISFSFRIASSEIGHKSLIDQFKRASASIPLNLSEGYSRFTKRDKLSFLRIAKGSTFECVSILNILRQIKRIDESTYRKIYELLRNVARMLSGMINHLNKGN